jgi:hypothetical protein
MTTVTTIATALPIRERFKVTPSKNFPHWLTDEAYNTTAYNTTAYNTTAYNSIIVYVYWIILIHVLVFLILRRSLVHLTHCYAHTVHDYQHGRVGHGRSEGRFDH